MIINCPFFHCSEIRQKLKQDVEAIRADYEGFKPGLAIVQVLVVVWMNAKSYFLVSSVDMVCVDQRVDGAIYWINAKLKNL